MPILGGILGGVEEGEDNDRKGDATDRNRQRDRHTVDQAIVKPWTLPILAAAAMVDSALDLQERH